MEKLLAFLVLLSSGVTAICVALMTIVYVTGELPFGIQPALEAKAAAGEKKEEKLDPYRQAERESLKLFDQLTRERQKLTERNREIDEQTKRVKDIEDNTFKLQDQLKLRQQEVEQIMITIKKENQESIKELARMMGDLDAQAAGKMLLQMLENPKDKQLVPKIFYYLNKKKAAEILSNFVNQGDKKKLEEAVQIAMDMQKVTEE